eukprot:11601819-Alexandrium_andersonii.AAC.1
MGRSVAQRCRLDRKVQHCRREFCRPCHAFVSSGRNTGKPWLCLPRWPASVLDLRIQAFMARSSS